MPSSPGIAMSSSSKSGESAWVRLIADSPSLAVPTSCAPSALASSSCSRSAASGSSSAMRTRSTSASAMGLDRQRQRNLEPTAGHWAEAAARTASKPRLETLAHIGKAEARSLVGGGRKLVLAAVLQPIADLQHHASVAEVAGLNANDHGLATFRHTIFYRILDDRLKEERRKARRLELLRNIDLDMEAVGETRHLDVEIQPLEVDLLGERDVGARVEREAAAEEGGKREQHGFGAVGAAGHYQR